MQIIYLNIYIYIYIYIYTLPETNSSHLKIGRAPKGNDRISTIHFQGRKCEFQGRYIIDVTQIVSRYNLGEAYFPWNGEGNKPP